MHRLLQHSKQLVLLALLLGGSFFMLALKEKNNSKVLLTSTQGAEPLEVVAGTSGVKIFDDNAPVQGLITFQNLVLGQLLRTTDDYTIEPALLKTARWNFQEHCYDLELRDGVRFHNGRLATAQDLEFTLVRGLFTKKASWFKSFLSNIQGISDAEKLKTYTPGALKGVQIVGDKKVRVWLSHPNPAFLHIIARSTFSLVPREELNPDMLTWKTVPIGAGPYRVSRVEDGTDAVVIEKVDAGYPGPTTIRFSTHGAQAGTDLVLIGATEAPDLTAQPLSKATSVTGIYFNFKNPLGANHRFREAVAKLVNRTALTEGVPEYTPSFEILASHQWGRAGIKEQVALDEAKSIIKDLGKLLPRSVIRIPVFNSNFQLGRFGKYLDELKSEFANAGLKIEFFDSPHKFLSEQDHESPFRIMSLGADPLDPLVAFNMFTKGSPYTHEVPPSDPQYSKLLDEANRAESLDVKAEAVKALSSYFIKQRYAVPLFERKPVILYNPRKIAGLGNQNGGLTFLFDRVVFQ